MMRVLDHIRARLLAPVLEAEAALERPAPLAPSYDELRRTEWSPRFEALVRNRLVVGAIRYGSRNARMARPYDTVGSMIRRLEAFRETGNAEALVDVAALCLLTFESEAHPAFHFEAVDDSEHVEVLR